MRRLRLRNNGKQTVPYYETQELNFDGRRTEWPRVILHGENKFARLLKTTLDIEQILLAARQLIDAIDQSDIEQGVGDRTTDENEAIRRLRLLISEI